MLNTFYTIKEDEYSAELIEKKSKFIATLLKVSSEEQAIEFIEKIRKKYRDAKHNVFAYRIANTLERYSDDGEPSGTAGVPILDILRGEKLENVLVVVTRYFGGILLGTGGLVRAYSTVTKQAIADAVKIEMKLSKEYEVVVDYNFHNILQHYFRENSIIIKDTIFSDKVSINIIVYAEKSENLKDKIIEKTEGTAKVILKETYYHE